MVERVQMRRVECGLCILDEFALSVFVGFIGFLVVCASA